MSLKEAVGDTLEQLWISYNLIDKTKGIGALRNLKVLYMSNNLIKEWSEFQKLQECQELKELSFMGKKMFLNNLSSIFILKIICKK